MARRTWQENFDRKVDRSGDPEGCQPWLAVRSVAGYGIFHMPNRGTVMAHRVAYELAHGPIPPGLVIDHLCHNKWCVKVEHLEAVSSRENFNFRAVGNGWQLNKAKTHCKRGHEFTNENTYRWGNGRQCKTCHKFALERYAAKRRTGIKPGRFNANKTHCPRGHEYTPENTYTRNGSRISRTCRECKRLTAIRLAEARGVALS